MFENFIAKLRAWLAMPERKEYAPSTLTDPRQFADSVNAKLVMPSKRLLDKSRDCTDYFKTDVQRHFRPRAAGAEAAGRGGCDE